jgi:hypothetical protein
MMTGEADQVRALTEAAFWAEHHRKRRDNPHEVAAGQVGAATVAGLAATVAGLAAHLAGVNPHGVTALQVALASAGFGYHPIWHRADTTTIAGLTGTVKWYGGVLGPDGKIYGIPCNSTSVLIIAGGMPALPIEPLLSPYLNKF